MARAWVSIQRKSSRRRNSSHYPRENSSLNLSHLSSVSDPDFLLFKSISESLTFLGPSSTAILVTKSPFFSLRLSASAPTSSRVYSPFHSSLKGLVSYGLVETEVNAPISGMPAFKVIGFSSSTSKQESYFVPFYPLLSPSKALASLCLNASFQSSGSKGPQEGLGSLLLESDFTLLERQTLAHVNRTVLAREQLFSTTVDSTQLPLTLLFIFFIPGCFIPGVLSELQHGMHQSKTISRKTKNVVKTLILVAEIPFSYIPQFSTSSILAY
ncbi:hypothetical protein QYF36_017108 [Acer negundo]|nr:hypothetical protein QYF36_017108 [Acer negundo]